MQVHRILERKFIKGQQNYLVQWQGYHRKASTWHSIQDIINNHPKQLIHFQMYQTQLSKNKPNKVHNFTNILYDNNEKQMNENSLKNKFRSSGSMRLWQQKCNQSLKEQVNLSVPSDQFKLVIRTDRKLQTHWAYNDNVQQIKFKKPNIASYQIVWSDGKSGQVTQSDLLQRESTKLCQFWEKRLGINLRKKRKC